MLHSQSLFILYIVVCVFFLTPFSSLITISLFSMSVSLLCFVNKFTCSFFFISHISDIIFYFIFQDFIFLTVFYLSLTSFSMVISGSIHVAADGNISFFSMVE